MTAGGWRGRGLASGEGNDGNAEDERGNGGDCDLEFWFHRVGVEGLRLGV